MQAERQRGRQAGKQAAAASPVTHQYIPHPSLTHHQATTQFIFTLMNALTNLTAHCSMYHSGVKSILDSTLLTKQGFV